MKKILTYFCVVFLLSCSNSYLKEEGKGDQVPSSPHERAMLGYDLTVVHGREINIKVSAKDDRELHSIITSLNSLGVEKQDVRQAFVEGEYFINARVKGEYPVALKKVRAMNEVVYADPNYKVSLQDGWQARPSDAILKPFSLGEGNLDSDPIADQKEYALAITEALRAYQEFGIGDNKVWAGIIDTGTNANHEDLKYPDGTRVVKVLKTAYGIRGVEEDKTGNSDYEPEHGGHGTHCSGTICAAGNNGKGIAGVAWKNVMLASYKGLIQGSGDAYKLYNALKDLVDTVRKNADEKTQATFPINLSLGSPVATSSELENINYAMSKGALLVVANGNDGQMIPSYPAAYPGMLSVGAIGGDDRKTSFSTTGPWTNVCAPGADIISLHHTSEKDYVYMSGTSMATPFVTGTVAYLLTFDPHLTPSQVIALLEKTADKVDATNTDPLARYDANGFSKWYGYGRVNVYRAAKAIKEAKVPKTGEVYVNTQLIIKIATSTENPIYIYDKSSGALVTATLATGTPAKAVVRGLRKGSYDVVYTGQIKEAKIDNTRNTTISFH